MKKVAILASTDRGVSLGLVLKKEFQKAVLLSTRETTVTDVQRIKSIAGFLELNYTSFDAILFIGALGICVRSIAPFMVDKMKDPAVLNMDDHGKFVQSVASGHAGGANELTVKIAAVLGAQAVITTSSDLEDLWALDLLAKRYKWKTEKEFSYNHAISLFVNRKRTAVLLEVKDQGTLYLERNKPSFADIYYCFADIDFSQYDLFIAVSYKKYNAAIASVFFYPQVLNVGMGCSRDIETELFIPSCKLELEAQGLAIESVKAIGSIDIKSNEAAFLELAKELEIPFKTFTPVELNSKEVVNPSEMVMQKLGVHSVSEASAMLLSSNGLLVEKQKKIVASGKMYTIAVAVDQAAVRKGSIAIVGAGPGDAELISVKGKYLLQEADLILYAGSLVPEELTACAKQGAVVRNSAGMDLEAQMGLMEEHYAKGHLIVRLHSGDPSIYGAIQEQMSIFDEKGLNYYIVPGISSFQAAAAYLRSEFTIPEVVQTIILTRGEGNTPLPEKEKLQEMAKHQATMCIFLSATIARDVQAQLLEHYPQDTPVAILYRVSWKDEEVHTGVLKDLASLIRLHKFTRTVLIIVGAAIGARKNRSQLYHPEYRHIFRTGKEAKIKV